MTAAKPWYDISNEREPGNALSRLPGGMCPSWGLAELLAVIDGETLAGDCLDARYDGVLAENQRLRIQLAAARRTKEEKA